jgi:predicted transcriptional regulator
VRDVQRDVRSSMLRQALALSGGSTQETARLLGVTRQAVSQMLHASKVDEPIS